MTDPHQHNPWADPATQPGSDPFAPPSQYAQPGQYPQYGQPAWSDPTATPAAVPPPAPFVSPDTPSYASGSSPVPTPMSGGPQYAYPPSSAPSYGYPQSSAPSYGYAAGYGGYGATPTYVPVMPQPKTNGMAIGSMVVSIVGITLVACYGGGGLLGIVGAILGHVARRQIKARKESGDGMALAGIIIGWISAGLGLLVVGLIVAFVVYAVNATPSSYDSGSGIYNALRAALV